MKKVHSVCFGCLYHTIISLYLYRGNLCWTRQNTNIFHFNKSRNNIQLGAWSMTFLGRLCAFNVMKIELNSEFSKKIVKSDMNLPFANCRKRHQKRRCFLTLLGMQSRIMKTSCIFIVPRKSCKLPAKLAGILSH